ncbi:hypothetical protein CSC75_20305 [Pseudoxanthomonas wuyuanensis]|nr:hypothetical protein CSC75_20305 [Pseudoxanthomonas wuyuanensis]
MSHCAVHNSALVGNRQGDCGGTIVNLAIHALLATLAFGADNTGFFIAGRAGAQSVNTRLSADGVSLRDRSTKPYVGVGVGYDFDHNNGLSLNYDYNTGDLFNADVTAQTLTLGYEYRF